MFASSFDRMYASYAGMVLRRARRMVGDEQAAEDIMQEVFLRAASGWLGFCGRASIATWLYRITTNQCLNHLRDEQSRRRRLKAAEPLTSRSCPAGLDDRLAVAALLRQLPEELREVAVYFYVDRMEQHEIAELTRISERTVRRRLRRFLAIAQQLLNAREVLR